PGSSQQRCPTSRCCDEPPITPVMIAPFVRSTLAFTPTTYQCNEAMTHTLRDTYHRLEELLNSWTHGIAAALSVIGTVVLIVAASRLGDVCKIVSFSVFGATLFLLYMASTLYHSTRHPKLRAAFKMLDHCAIFLLIAGTYTPFLLVNM